jgi:hypothetical protein
MSGLTKVHSAATVVSGSAAPVIFGILWSVGYGFITWTYLHLA